MGCCGSTDRRAAYRAEADAYAERKKNGFKDPELEKWRKDGIKQKKKLKHVEDPLAKKKITMPEKPKPKPPKGGPTLVAGPSLEDELKKAKGKLKKRR